jgi:hypothetical protein
MRNLLRAIEIIVMAFPGAFLGKVESGFPSGNATTEKRWNGSSGQREAAPVPMAAVRAGACRGA